MIAWSVWDLIGRFRFVWDLIGRFRFSGGGAPGLLEKRYNRDILP
jgi:hypothetical protein